MKNTLFCLILFASLSLCLLAGPGQEETQGVQEAQVIVKKAKIHLEATPFSAVVDTVGRGTVVALFPSGEKDKKWLYISYYSIKRDALVTGFIRENAVEIFQKSPEMQKESIEQNPQEAKDQEDRPQIEAGSAGTEKEAEEKAPPVESETPKEIKNEDQTSGTQRAGEEMEVSTTEEKEQVQDEKAAAKEQQPPAKIAAQNNEKTIETESEEQKVEQKETASEKPKTEEEEQAMKKEAEQAATEAEMTQSGKKENEAESHSFDKQEESPEEGTNREETAENQKEDAPRVLTKVSIKVPMANIRLMPTLQSSVIDRAPSGVELETLAKTGKWYRVNLPPNEEGYVLSGYVHQSIVNEIYESVLPAGESEEPEAEQDTIGEEPEPVPEPEKQVEPPPQTEMSGRPFWIGAGAGYTLPFESRLAKGMSFGGTLGLEIIKYLALEFRFPYFRSEVTESFGGLDSGQLRNLTFMLSVQVRYPLNDQLVPYLVGGGDYHLNKFNINEGIEDSWNDLGFTIEENVDHSIGFHVGAGFDYFLLKNIALNVDVRYYSAKLKGTWSIANQISQQEVTGNIEDIKLDSIQAGISFKFFLGR